MPPGFMMQNSGFMQIDAFASLVIMVVSFMVFYKTKDLYELSGHKGIKYFRQAFLLFGLTFLVQLVMPSFKFARGVFPSRTLATVLLIYLGTLAVFMLLYSALWKRIKTNKLVPLVILNTLALLIALSTFFTRARLSILVIQMAVFVVAVLFVFVDSVKKKKKHTGLYTIYVMLFFAWMANTGAIFALRTSFTLGNALNIISAILFLIILHKVTVKLK